MRVHSIATALALTSALVAVLACSSSDPTSPAPASDAGGDVASSSSSSGAGVDGGGGDAARDAAGDARTGDGGGSGKACAFNRECPADERCECSEAAGCACKTGPRGTGKNGVDTCKDGNDCASSVCVEGPASGTAFYCSDECSSPAQCGGALPVCADIATLGKICVRTP